MRRLLSLILLLICSLTVQARPDVRVVGLFSDRAVVVVDGRQQVLRVGQDARQGVRLLSADSERAVLEVDGERMEARLDGRVTARKREPGMRSVQIKRDISGMYTTVGSINGLTVSFLVDTGASHIAMNTQQARRLGIDYRVSGTSTQVSTASGLARAWRVLLDTVKVGELEQRQVSAVVIEGGSPEITLLGMSYLGRLELANDGQLMTLRKKY